MVGRWAHATLRNPRAGSTIHPRGRALVLVIVVQLRGGGLLVRRDRRSVVDFARMDR